MAKVIDKSKAKVKAKLKDTYYLLIVDSSGSMANLYNTTINGINEQIELVKELSSEYPDQNYNMSFIHFNNKITIEYFKKPSSEISKINESNYKCNGTTALLDAIGTGVNKLNSEISSKIESGEASAVVVIITDGEENSSTEYNSEKIKQLVEELQNTGKWTFTFVGANIDSITTAKSYGIDVSNVMQFSSDNLSNQVLYSSISRSFKSRASKISNDTYNSKDFLDEADKDVTTKS